MCHIYKFIHSISEAIVRDGVRVRWNWPGLGEAQCDPQHSNSSALKAIPIFLLEGPAQSCWSPTRSVLSSLA